MVPDGSRRWASPVTTSILRVVRLKWAPNMDDPTVKAEFQKLVQALGARFDGLPGFGPIDIGSVGLWGEWHNWATSIISINGNAPGTVGQHIPMPSDADSNFYIDLYFTYFPNTMKIMGSMPSLSLIGGPPNR